MFRILLSFPIFLFSTFISAQSFELIAPLEAEVSETSGVICIENRIITHNDSMNDPKLYELDSLTGNVLRTVVVSNAPNIDWEDIAYDDTYLYVGDFGNQNGNRTNLRVLRILRSDYFETDIDTVSAEIIAFSYADQTEFTPSQFATKYDAEALVAFGDSLYVFTKDWLDYSTSIYALSKIPGTYSINKVDSINTNGLVTGADINESTNSLMLSCYNVPVPFALLITNFTNSAFSLGTVETIAMPIPDDYSFQIEAVCQISDLEYYFTAEESLWGAAGLYKLDFNTSGLKSKESYKQAIYPNPASNYIQLDVPDFENVTFFNSDGKMVKTVSSKYVNVSDLATGLYTLHFRGNKNHLIGVQKLIIQ